MTSIQFVNLVQIGQVFWSGGRNGPCRETSKQESKREQRAAREESNENFHWGEERSERLQS